MTKYIHLRAGDPFRIYPKGGFTIAYDYDKEARIAIYAVARCSSKDHYCKAIGRDWASKRLELMNNSTETQVINLVKVPEAHSIVGTIVQHFFDHTKGL